MLRTSIITAVTIFLLATPASAIAMHGPIGGTTPAKEPTRPVNLLRDGKYAARVSPALASNCQPYRATGHDTATSTAGPYVGLENVTIGKTTYNNVPAVTSIIAPLTPQGDSGVLTTRTSHTIALPTGTITTTDDVHLIPTQAAGIYKLISHLALTSGATGELLLHGTLNLGTLSAEGAFAGVICGLS